MNSDRKARKWPHGYPSFCLVEFLSQRHGKKELSALRYKTEIGKGEVA